MNNICKSCNNPNQDIKKEELCLLCQECYDEITYKMSQAQSWYETETQLRYAL